MDNGGLSTSLRGAAQAMLHRATAARRPLLNALEPLSPVQQGLRGEDTVHAVETFTAHPIRCAAATKVSRTR
jgi:hypothetical protein